MSAKTKLIVYWIRRDFRLFDNPALFEGLKKAKEENRPFLGIYILDKGLLSDNSWNIGNPRRLFLANLLCQFANKISNFVIYSGTPEEVFEKLSQKFQIQLFLNKDIEEYSLSRDKQVQEIIENSGGQSYPFKDQLTIFENIKTGSGNLYSVFTPFKNAVLDEFLSAKTYPEVSVDGLKDIQQIDYQNENSLYLGQNVIKKLSQLITSADIFSLIKKNNQLYLKPFIEPVNLDKIVEINEQDIVKNWYCNEEQCHAVWERFLESNLLQYKLNRDSLENDVLNNSGATSRMSVGLKWGLVSSRFLKESVLSKYGRSEIFNNQNLYHYISELIWREFYKYILYHHPNVLDQEFQTKFRESISWVENSVGLERFITWIKGETGYKIVDAAMQQIRQLGWMHNRSRMIVASILTKNLGVDWRWGQEYFRFMLLDLDEASNNGGWQWASSVGSDPKPIRIFNPYLQAENYDSKNLYQKKWLPSDYSIEKPIIDHKIAREQALLRYNLNNLKPRDY